MKPADAEMFQKRKGIEEVGENKNDDFDMDIIEEGALEKALNIKKKTPGFKKKRKTIYEII